MGWYDWGWAPRPSVSELRHRAKLQADKLRKKGQALEPIVIEGRKITRTFWGNAWCTNLERYSDFANRLERGRSYVRNGLVLHLAIKPGAIDALVCGSSLYETTVAITPISRKRWKAVCGDLTGSIDSLVELLQGRFSSGVMERISRQGDGLFPAPAEIHFECSCPDYAMMCKHVAAVLYGIGARLDQQPALLFTLRKVDAADLISNAGDSAALAERGPGKERVLADANLSEMFGLEMAAEGHSDDDATVADRKRPTRRAKTSKKLTKGKPARKTTGARKKAARSTRASTKRKAASRAKRGTK